MKPLSPRQHEIARLLVTGAKEDTIAEQLRCKPATVDTQIRRIYQKLQVNCRCALGFAYGVHVTQTGDTPTRDRRDPKRTGKVSS